MIVFLLQEIVKDLQSQIKTKKAGIATQNKEIKGITQKKEQLLASNADIELEIKELEHQIAKMKSEAAGCEDKVSENIGSKVILFMYKIVGHSNKCVILIIL